MSDGNFNLKKEWEELYVCTSVDGIFELEACADTKVRSVL